MNMELKDTLQKFADYGEMQKQNAVKAGSIAFAIAYIVCTITIVIQMVVTRELRMIIGETITLLAAGIVYLYSRVRSGAFDNKKGNSGKHQNPGKRHTIISLICAGAFFAAMAITGRMVLAILDKTNEKYTKMPRGWK